MNVKPTDIARIVNDPKNNGRIVKVLRPDPDVPAHWMCEALQTISGYRLSGPFWMFAEVDKIPAGAELAIADADLRPLHDGDGEDEMLRIAGKPQETVREAIADIAHPRRQVEFTR